jgi:hypothetical protein
MPNLQTNTSSFARLCFVVFFFLVSCSDHDIKKTPGHVPTPPDDDEPYTPLPVPDNKCSQTFSYGYCDKVSYRPDEKITAFIHSTEKLDLCKLDIYTVNGTLAFSVGAASTVQFISTSNPSSEGYGFIPTAEFKVPDRTKSGIYLIENKIPFIILPSTDVDVLIVYSSNTANAYCQAGGKSLYSKEERPGLVSFERPMDFENFSTVCMNWFTTLPDLKIGYAADIDLENFNILYQSKIVAIVGHSEYWTRQARENFDRYVNSGGHGLIFSGNTMWWQVRYSADKKKLICYKDAALDPEPSTSLKTILWTDPSLSYNIISSIGADFNHGGYGLRTDEGWNGFKITAPTSPLLQGTNLLKGDVITCPTSEYDGAPLAGWTTEADPILDLNAMHAMKGEIIGFDKGFRGAETYPTFIAFQRSASSGIIINTGSTDWCSSNGMGGASGDIIKRITLNAIQKLLKGETVFSL